MGQKRHRKETGSTSNQNGIKTEKQINVESDCSNTDPHPSEQWAPFHKSVKVLQWRKKSLSTDYSGTPRNPHGKV